jgi:hypothetical protein
MPGDTHMDLRQRVAEFERILGERRAECDEALAPVRPQAGYTEPYLALLKRRWERSWAVRWLGIRGIFVIWSIHQANACCLQGDQRRGEARR